MVDGAARRRLPGVVLVEAPPLPLADALGVLRGTAAPLVPDLPAVALVAQGHADREPHVVVVCGDVGELVNQRVH